MYPPAVTLGEYIHDPQSIEIDSVPKGVVERKAGHTDVRSYKIADKICDLILQVWERIWARFFVTGGHRPRDAVGLHIVVYTFDRDRMPIAQKSAPVRRVGLIDHLKIAVDKCLRNDPDLIVDRVTVGITAVILLGRLADAALAQNNQTIIARIDLRMASNLRKKIFRRRGPPSVKAAKCYGRPLL